MTMDWDNFGDWVIWLVLAAAFLVMSLIALMTIVVAVCQVINCVQARRSPSVFDDLLDTILQDVAYQLLPDNDEEQGRCAICVTPYESGEPCSVLPACAHMSHKPCVAKWLRNTNTCPLCRATVRPALVPPSPPPQPVNAAVADDMV